VDINTGAVPTPLEIVTSMCDDLLELVPDNCLSVTEMKTMPFPDSVVPSEMKTLPLTAVSEGEKSLSTSSDSESEEELEEFLLDAAQWL
jgi:hypothetical protein